MIFQEPYTLLYHYQTCSRHLVASVCLSICLFQMLFYLGVRLAKCMQQKAVTLRGFDQRRTITCVSVVRTEAHAEDSLDKLLSFLIDCCLRRLIVTSPAESSIHQEKLSSLHLPRRWQSPNSWIGGFPCVVDTLGLCGKWACL